MFSIWKSRFLRSDIRTGALHYQPYYHSCPPLRHHHHHRQYHDLLLLLRPSNAPAPPPSKNPIAITFWLSQLPEHHSGNEYDVHMDEDEVVNDDEDELPALAAVVEEGEDGGVGGVV